MSTAKTKVESGIDTRRRLLEAAEALFSEEGFDAVSLRDITEKAGANVAAVNYHFNSREHLVELIMERYINPINDERLVRLDTLERKSGGKGLRLEEILDAFVRPFATQVRKSELSEKMFYQLMGRCLADRSGVMPKSVERGFQLMLIRFERAFEKALPGLDVEELLWRVHFTVGAMIHTMAHAGTFNRLTRWNSGTPAMEKTLSRFIRFSAAGLRQGTDQELHGEQPRTKGPQDEFLF